MKSRLPRRRASGPVTCPHKRRAWKSRPPPKKIEALLPGHLHRVTQNSVLGKALRYLAAQWQKRIRFVDNGAWPIDNNRCENAIRPFVVGRRNRLFADTVGGAHASANLCSLIGTCKANCIAPYTYLVGLFRKLPLAKTDDDFEASRPASRLTPPDRLQPRLTAIKGVVKRALAHFCDAGATRGIKKGLHSVSP